MPNLRNNERMQKCLAPFHSIHRRQAYYKVRGYYSPVENCLCQGCLRVIELGGGVVSYSTDKGYAVTNQTALLRAIPALKKIKEFSNV